MSTAVSELGPSPGTLAGFDYFAEFAVLPGSSYRGYRLQLSTAVFDCSFRGMLYRRPGSIISGHRVQLLASALVLLLLVIVVLVVLVVVPLLVVLEVLELLVFLVLLVILGVLVREVLEEREC